MSVISRLASSLGRRDEVPNKELARELYDTRNRKDIAELVENLFNTNKAIRHDCIEVLYWIGCIDPGLISQYVSEFLRLLSSKSNRMVWGAMITLSTIALERADEIYANIDLILKTIEDGSVITVDNGISVLAKVSSTKETYEKKIIPYLLKHLQECRPKEVGQHTEKSMIAMNVRNKEQFKKVLLKRLDDLSESQKARVKRVLQKI